MRYSILIVLFVMPLVIMAQGDYKTQAATDFRAVNEAYINSGKLKMDVNYTLFPSYTSVEAFEKDRGVYMKDGKNSFSNLLGIISLSNSRASVTLDSNEQTIVVADPATKEDRNPGQVNLDTLLRICTSIEYKALPDGLKYYKLNFQSVPVFEYNAIEVYIDGKTNFLSRITMYFRMEMDMDDADDVFTKQKPRLEIVYTNVSTSPVFAQDQFSESKYINTNGKAITAAAAYSKFRLINNKIR